jgi:antitoxin MazE
MITIMQIPVIQVGNSKGIRLNKTILEKYQIKDKIELIFEEEFILIKPMKTPRQNWDLAFAEMHKNSDDNLLIDDVFEDENWD